MEKKENPGTDVTDPVSSSEITKYPVIERVKAGTSGSVILELEPGSDLDLSIHILGRDGTLKKVLRRRYKQKTPLSLPCFKKAFDYFQLRQLQVSFTRNWPVVLLVLACSLYLLTRFIGLDSYPIYFFTDEAVQTVLAQDLVRDGFKSYTGEILPTFFENGSQFNLGVSVYAQVIPYLVFGKSIWVTRGVSILLSLLAVLSTGFIFKDVLKSRLAFVAVLILSITPAWFLHSRTAFETVLGASFFAGFLYFYLRYRTGSPVFLFGAVGFGALCFYSYSPAQVVISIAALAFLIVDWKTHVKNWKTVLVCFGITLVLTVPYIRFLILHPGENLHHLKVLNSYWVREIPLGEKLFEYFKNYLQLMNPVYWFSPEQFDLSRHVMKGYGHVLRWVLPFFIIGLGKSLLQIKHPVYRAFLITLLVSPAGAAVASMGITRSLFMVIPVSLITALGIEQVGSWLAKTRLPQGVFPGVTFTALAAVNLFMMGDALKNGPTWYDDYGLGGQQYGARQLFGEIRGILEKDPGQKIFLSPSWTNGTDILTRYFFDDPVPFEMGSVDSLLFSRKDFTEDQLFIFLPDEIEKARESGKFKEIRILKTLDYPDGNPGFYFVNMKYVDNIDRILEDEKQARAQLLEKTLVASDGTRFVIRYSALDMGEIDALFDRDPDSMVRTIEANPIRLEIRFVSPQSINEVIATIGGSVTVLDLEVKPSDGSPTLQRSVKVGESNQVRDISIKLGAPVMADEVILSIMDAHSGEPSHVHVWEIKFK